VLGSVILLGAIGALGTAAVAFQGCYRDDAGAGDPPVSQATGVEHSSVADADVVRRIRFSDIAHRSGIDLVLPQQPRPMRIVEAFGSGAGLFDYDQDGWQDVLVVARPHVVLYRNRGNATFENVTEQAGLRLIEGHWYGCAVADYDGDGFLDLLLTGFERLALLRNLGGAEFRDVTVEVGLDETNFGEWASSAGFMDLDGDSQLDLVLLDYGVFDTTLQQYCEYAANSISSCRPQTYEPRHGHVWRQTAAGRFEQLPDRDAMPHANGYALVLAFTDLDHDGRMDFYVGNDGLPSEMLHNRDALRFDNIGNAAGVSLNKGEPMAAMGADFADYDRDGREDLIVTDFSERSYAVYRYLGGLAYESVADRLGIALPTYVPLGFGCNWLDLDNDGWQDIAFVNGHVYENADQQQPGSTFRQPMHLFHNRQGRAFVDLVPALQGDVARPIVGRGSATGDLDNDGRTDLLVVDYEGPPLLLHNESQTGDHWIRLDLRSPSGNRFAYGARVEARAGEALWTVHVSPASSYLSTADPRIHFGLGDAARLDTLTIHWPSGQVEELHDVAADAGLVLLEGQGIVRRLEPQRP
jgi:hypothetical protein